MYLIHFTFEFLDITRLLCSLYDLLATIELLRQHFFINIFKMILRYCFLLFNDLNRIRTIIPWIILWLIFEVTLDNILFFLFIRILFFTLLEFNWSFAVTFIMWFLELFHYSMILHICIFILFDGPYTLDIFMSSYFILFFVFDTTMSAILLRNIVERWTNCKFSCIGFLKGFRST